MKASVFVFENGYSSICIQGFIYSELICLMSSPICKFASLSNIACNAQYTGMSD